MSGLPSAHFYGSLGIAVKKKLWVRTLRGGHHGKNAAFFKGFPCDSAKSVYSVYGITATPKDPVNVLFSRTPGRYLLVGALSFPDGTWTSPRHPLNS